MPRNFDDEFAVSAHIPGAERLPALWAKNAAAYRSQVRMEADIRYGDAERNLIDLVLPDGASKGLLVFVHGGFWTECSKHDWTDLAEGAREQGWSVALPGYTLAPQARISGVVDEITAAIARMAQLVDGPIRLAGHSAGGHLVTRMMCQDSGLPKAVLARIEKVVSISGLHDLRLLQQTKVNKKLQLDDAEADRQSPALLRPLPQIPLTCWVGTKERPEFIRQSHLLAMIWHGLAATKLVEDQDQDHFSILDGLKRGDSPLMREILA